MQFPSLVQEVKLLLRRQIISGVYHIVGPTPQVSKAHAQCIDEVDPQNSLLLL